MPEQLDRPMTAAVEFQIRPEVCSMQDWLDLWSIRAKDAEQGEPQTQSYATAINLEEPKNVLVFERYSHGASSVALHTEREAHADLIQHMGERNMTKRQVMMTSFDDLPDFGFWARPGSNPTPASRLTLLGLRFASQDMQQRWVSMVGEHAAYCAEHELPTLIYSAGIANQDAKAEADVRSGDLIVAMLSADEEGIRVHQNDTRHLALQAAFASEGIEREMLFVRRYQVSGHGYWWR